MASSSACMEVAGGVAGEPLAVVDVSMLAVAGAVSDGAATLAAASFAVAGGETAETGPWTASSPASAGPLDMGASGCAVMSGGDGRGAGAGSLAADGVA